MIIQQLEINLPPFKRGYHLITSHIVSKLTHLPEKGLVNIFIQHTSAALSINENAAPSVRADFEKIMNNLIPEGQSWYTHTQEGDDDMPAHIKASLFDASINIPITNHKLNLGTWQGIYLCEFRNKGGSRTIIVTVLG